MYKSIKKLLITSASLLMLASVGAGVSSLAKPAHASMPDPEIYHPTKHRDNVYYKLIKKHHNGKYYWTLKYGRMPRLMKRRGHIFQLYYGKKFYKQYGHSSFYKPIYRHGAKYVPDYVGYVLGSHSLNEAIEIMVNKRDIGRPFKHQLRALDYASKHHEIFTKPVKYLPLHHHHVHRHHHGHHKHAVRRFHHSHKRY